MRIIKKIVFNSHLSGIEDFRFSIEELLTLDHPNIQNVYDYKEDLYNFYIIMEYCNGGKLIKKIEELEVMSENLAAEITR